MYYNPYKGFWEPLLEYNEMNVIYIYGENSNPKNTISID